MEEGRRGGGGEEVSEERARGGGGVGKLSNLCLGWNKYLMEVARPLGPSSYPSERHYQIEEGEWLVYTHEQGHLPRGLREFL